VTPIAGPTDPDRLAAAFARFDAENAEDPRRDGDEPYEVVYSRRMSERLALLEPEASDALRLAVRAQHLARWRIPRDRYPDGRVGYRRWRADLGRMHAERAAEILAEVGYPPAVIERVRDLIQKRRLRQDAEVQVLEDVACLVFLEHYCADFAAKHDRAKLVDIVSKTWNKMSERGHRAALELTPALSPALRSILEEALATPSTEPP
jgi:hypothetical protein